MKKKILASIFVFVLTYTALTATVFAERKTELQVTLIQDSILNRQLTIRTFEVTKVENLYGQSGKYLNRVHFNMEYNDPSGFGDLYLVFMCYDAQGMPLKTVDFNSYSKYIDVPDTTAMIEITMEDPTANSQSYLYCKYVNVYAPDGRVMAVTDLQVPVYELVGWSKGVTMYAYENGGFARTITVSPYDVEAYKAVGWYTKEAVEYKKIQNSYNAYKTVGDYNSIIKLVDNNLSKLAGTEYEDDLYAIRTEAMDLWRNATGAPLGVINYKLSENSIGTPEVSIEFRNISYKKIVAFKLKFTCYDIFGDVEDSYYDYYYIDSANLDVAKSNTYIWTLYGAESVHRIENIHLTEVVFEDGTKWKR